MMQRHFFSLFFLMRLGFPLDVMPVRMSPFFQSPIFLSDYHTSNACNFEQQLSIACVNRGNDVTCMASALAF